MKTRKTYLAAAIAATAIALLSASPVRAQHHAHTPTLGKVQFKVDCNEAAQREFNLAMAYYHSFAWNHLNEPLERVLKADPTCGMAHWARALGMLDNPFTWPGAISAKTLAEGPVALEAARATGLKSQRERDYVDALAVFFKDHDKLNHRARAKALEDAMAQVAQRYPDDKEASILYALVLSANFDPTDKQYANQLKAAGILEPISKEQPDHPGVAHYLIHSYDYPALASRGMDAARRYGKLAADASHALHMPSHIFTRVGAWKESIESNAASAKAGTDKTFDKWHAYDYMVYAHLQLGQEAAARQVIRDAQTIPTKVDNFPIAYAYGAMPARFALERGAWAEAAKLDLTPAPSAFAWNKYPQAEAVNAFARGVGAAATKDATQARAEVARLVKLRDATTGYWAGQIDIQSEVVRGLATIAEGKTDEGIEMLRQAATREDATEKHVVTPGPLLPAREVLASALLDAGKPADALREYDTVLTKEPNRLRATGGAGLAAERSGDKQKARLHYTKVMELTASADAPRPEAVNAKKFLGRG
ncbi:MAG: tetratricopeptide repeat protein [Burkholderiaceae bacterium]